MDLLPRLQVALTSYVSSRLGDAPYNATVNEVIKRALVSAKIASHLEQMGICRANGKLPFHLEKGLYPHLECHLSGYLCTLPSATGCQRSRRSLLTKQQAKYTKLAGIETSVVFGPEALPSLWNLAAAYKRRQGRLSLATTYSSRLWWQCIMEMLPQCWAHHQSAETCLILCDIILMHVLLITAW